MRTFGGRVTKPTSPWKGTSVRHARPDYDERIQDSAGLIPDDEPVLLIRGQDRCALAAAAEWCRTARKMGASATLIRIVENHADRIAAWQVVHGSKVPDLPAPDVSGVTPWAQKSDVADTLTMTYERVAGAREQLKDVGSGSARDSLLVGLVLETSLITDSSSATLLRLLDESGFEIRRK